MTPLVAARTRKKLKRGELVDALRQALGLGDELGARVTQAYSELERDLIDVARVDQSVWSALRDLLGLDVRQLWERRGRRSRRGAAYFRVPAELFEPAPAPLAQPDPGPTNDASRRRGSTSSGRLTRACARDGAA